MRGHPEFQFGGRLETAFSKRFGASILGAGQVMLGDVQARDAIVAGVWRPTKRAGLTLTVRPGFTIPFAGISRTVAFTPLGTRSVDPWLGVDLVGGGAWVGAASAQVQAPLVAGRDGWRQGVYGRLDLRVARRLGANAVVFSGLSGITRSAGEEPDGALSELAVVAGGLYTVSKRVGINAQLRVPVAMSPSRAYWGAAALGMTWVAGKPLKRAEAGEEGEDEHHEEPEATLAPSTPEAWGGGDG